MTNTKFSISAAARIIGKTRSTVRRHVEAGKLSVEMDRSGKKRIDASELTRVYGDDCRFERAEKGVKHSDTKRVETTGDDAVAAVKVVQEQLIEQYVAQIDHLKEALSKAQDGQNRVSMLLENQFSETSAWERQLDAMTEKLSNQTRTEIQELRRRHDDELKKIRRALHNERNKTVWEKFFGQGRKRATGK